MLLLDKYLSDVEVLNGGLPFMVGRDSKLLKDLIDENKGKVLNIDNFGTMELPNQETGELQNVGVFTVREDEKNFFFGGSVITDTLCKLEKIVGDDWEQILKEGIPVTLEERKSKRNNRIYNNLRIVTE